MGRLDGKVALITGAARGQGRSHALTLAREGAEIIALDLESGIAAIPYGLATRADLERTVQEVEQLDRRIVAVTGDVRQQEDLDRAVASGIEEFGKIDIVVANAGVWSVGDFWKLSEAEWQAVLDVNVSGVWRTIKAVTPHLIEREQGSIVLVSSVNGLEGARRYAHYVASKHAVSGFMKCVALELGPYGIRCNTINPGAIDTPLLRWQGAYDMMAGGEGLGTEAHLALGGRANHLLKDRSLLSSQSTSNAVLWLASDESNDVTGLELVVDAGHMLMPGLDVAAIFEAATNAPSA